MDWLSRLFEMMPVRGRLDLRCSYGVPWCGDAEGLKDPTDLHRTQGAFTTALPGHIGSLSDPI
jgi:hypothetical protein